MAEITATMVKELREKSGAPMMDCKKALTEANGDLEQAIVVLRKRGMATAAKKATRTTSEGVVTSYIHAGGKIGVLLEVNCESDFVARTAEFQGLVHDIAMHIAAVDPRYVRKEDVTAADMEKEKDIYRAQAAATGKPAYGGGKDLWKARWASSTRKSACWSSRFIKEQSITITQLIATVIGKLGENISVRRFARFKVGEATETIAVAKPLAAAGEAE